MFLTFILIMFQYNGSQRIGSVFNTCETFDIVRDMKNIQYVNYTV